MSFQTIQKNELVYLTSDILSGVRHGFSTRKGGVSPAPWDSLNLDSRRGDSIDNVQENFRLLCDALEMNVQRAVLSKQVHRDDVRVVTAADAGKGLWVPQDYDSADALITNVPELPLFVFSADCGVILLHDPVHHAIGAVHAGWRGTVMGIVGKAVQAMQAAYGTDPANLIAAIGPSIGQCCFETDDDVPAALRQAMGADAEGFMVWNGRKWHIDLKGVNRYWLQSAGVTHIDLCDHCTYCLADLYWSHRRTGLQRGEQAAVIALPSDKELP